MVTNVNSVLHQSFLISQYKFLRCHGFLSFLHFSQISLSLIKCLTRCPDQVGEVEGWVTEQERDVTQTSIAEELPFLLHQLNKHNEFERELTGTEPLLAAVNEKAANLIENGHSKEVEHV